MFLKKLTIKRIVTDENIEIIRSITFHRGINLIVDYTSLENHKESGNNIGKTTVLRLIDYCLGGKGGNIYSDPEFKGYSSGKIENFLKENNIVISIEVVEDLDKPSDNDIQISRNFLQRKQKIQEINGIYYNDADFKRQLKLLIFDSEGVRPTIREILAKNVRDEKDKLSNTLRVLHNSTTAEEYEVFYMFLLGIDLSVDKIGLEAQRKIEEKLQERLSKTNNLESIEQALILINKRIEKLAEQKAKYTVDIDYRYKVDYLNTIKKNISITSGEISAFQTRIELIEDSKIELEKDFSDADTERVRVLYERTKSYIPSLQTTFEELNSFHNLMINERISFITEELPKLKNQLRELKEKLQEFLTEESKLSEDLRKVGLLEDQEKIVNELNKLYLQKGSYETEKSLWLESKEKLDSVNLKIIEINNNIRNQDTLIQERISRFNDYFSKITARLYGEDFYLSSRRTDNGALDLMINSISGNLGSGKKKGQIIAFDLAYIQFCDAINKRCLHFILHDQIEQIHGNQIYTLLAEVIGNMNCQLIVPVLKDKLPHELELNLYEVLKLSERDKLFKLD